MIAIGQYTISTIFDGDSYVIQPSVSSVVIEDSGIYNPSEITFNNKHKQGNGELENYSGRLKIETTSDNTNWTTQYTSSSNETSKVYSLPSATIDKEPYNFRKSPVTSGSKSEIIVGGSLAWNQLVQNTYGRTNAGVTYSCSNNILTISGTASAKSYWKTSAGADAFDVVSGHKYLAHVGNSNFSGSASTYRLYMSYASSYITNPAHIITFSETNTTFYQMSVENGQSVNISICPQLIDLTALFGTTIADYIYSLETANAGAGVAWVKRYIDLDTYHEYCEPTLKSVEGLVSHDVVGFNQWDEEWENGYYSSTTGKKASSNNCIRCKNKIPVIPGATYFHNLTNSYLRRQNWDADGNFISQQSVVEYREFTIPDNAHYITFFCDDAYGKVYNHDICINISDPSRNGTYEPYEKHSYPLDPTVKLNGVFKLVGDHLEADGDRWYPDKGIERRYGIVLLNGEENWNGSAEHGWYIPLDSLKKINIVGGYVGHMLADKVPIGTWGEKGTMYGYYDSTNKYPNQNWLYYSNQTLSSVSDVKSYFASNPTTVIYPLATPTTETAQPFQSPMIVGATEEYISDSVVPVGHESKYTSDIKNIRASLYKAGGTTALLNQITIPVLSQEDFKPKLINTIRQYTKSTSSTSLPSNPTWVDDEEPTIGDNEYMWARLKHVYSDGTFVYSNAVCSTSISGAIHNVDKANKSITDKVWESDITTKINQYDGSTVSTIRDRVSTTETDISGIKTRVSDVENETDDLGTRMTTAETAIEQTANNVVIKATESDTTAAQGGQHLIQSLINVAPSGVTISADKVNIEGAAIFSSGRLSQTNLNNSYDSKGSAAAVQTNLDNLEIGGRNLVKHTTSPKANNTTGLPSAELSTTDGWYKFGGGSIERTTDGIKITSATSSQTPTGLNIPLVDYDIVTGTETLTLSFKYRTNSSNWSQIYLLCRTSPNVAITMPALTVSTTNWLDFKHTFNFGSHADRIAFSLLIGYKRDDGSSWLEIKDGSLKLEFGQKATSWTPAPEDQFASTVPCYYRKTTSGAPSAPSSTVGTSNNTDNTWTYVMPLPKKNCYFFTCEEYTNVGGAKSYSTVRALDSQTYTSKWVSSSDQTYIDGGSIYTHSITTSQLATDAIKSTNYLAGGTNSPYSSAGTFLDLSNGNFYTPNFGVQSLTGEAFINGEIIATSGSIGDDSGNYWEIGNTTDSQGNGSASIVGNGTAYIQDGDWQIHSGLSNYSNGSINTQWYTTPQGGGLQLTYPYYDGYYYDYGMTSPVLDTTSSRFYNQTVSQNFLYIRKHASTIPALESDWNYIFRVDKDGMVWINGQSITQMIQSGVDGGAYVPTSGGTITGNLTVTGTLTATASKANQLTHSISVNGKAFDGSANVTVGTIGAAYGGTGQTSLKAAGTAIIGALDTNTTTPVDNDYIATGSSTFYRKTMSKLWDYIKGKITNDHSNLDSLYVLKSGDTMTGSLTVEDSIYADSAQLGDLVVSGSGRFANGLYGNLTGNADTATKAAKVADIGNGNDITLNYSGTNYSTTSWFAAWNGYQLGAISPANVLKTIGADKSASISDRINITNSGSYNWGSATNDDKLITSNTLAYWNGAYNSSSHASNIEYVKAGKLGDIVTHNASEFLTTSGNAASASKFNTARSIALTGDVTGSASSDGSSGWSIATTVQDNSHNHYLNTIQQDQSAVSGGLDPLTQAMVGSAASNKTFGLPAKAITIEYSRNGGSTWTAYDCTDNQKRDLFNETRGFGCYIGQATTKELNTTNNQLRITIEPVDRYCWVSGLYVWMSNNGNTCTVDMERSTIGAKDTYTTVFTGQAISGWAGNNIRYFSGAHFGGGSTQTSNCYKYRLTFKQTAINADYPSGIIIDIRFFGVSVHSINGVAQTNMLTKNHLYTWDRDFNVTFPYQVTATAFNGNASSATKLNSTRSFTIGNTAKNVDWSGAVSYSKAEISDEASSTVNGWMSVADKKKLDSITVSDIGTIGANSIRGEKDIKVTISSGIATIGHENAAITAGTISGTATSTLSNGGSFKIPSITYDAYGHITGTAQTTVTLPNITSVSGNAGTATKFSSARAISLSGDVSGTATADGSSGWSITTTVADDSHNHTVDTIVSKLSKTYTGVIATANNQADGNFYFIKVVPEAYGKKWTIHYRVYAEIAGVTDANGNGKEFSDVYIAGARDNYITYKTWNDIAHTSYRPYYYHAMYRARESVIAQGHGLGLGLRSSYNQTTAANSRTITFEIIDYEGCTVSFLDTPVKYTGWPSYSSSNYLGITEFDATTQGNTMSGDRNDANYQNREYYASRTAYSYIGRYMLVLSRPDSTIIPTVSVDNNVTTTKTYNTTDEFDPFGEIYYFWGGSPLAAGGNVYNGYLTRQVMMDIRYAFNVGGYNTDSLITARKPFYLVATPQSNGMAKIHSSGFSQTLPTSDNGLIYIYLGTIYEDTYPYRLNLALHHPVYWYKNGAVRQYVQRAETANTANSATTAGSATNANYANNLLAYNGNETTIGANSSTAGGSTNNVVWFNYRDVEKGTITNDSAQIARYYFGNRKGSVTGVSVHAANFVGDLTGNASTATSATKATQDGDGNTIASTYLKLSGGTMTGAINLPYNKQSVSFRSDNASYDSGFVYGTGGNEALALVQQNAVTSFMVVHGSDPATWTTSTWNSSSPTLQTKNNSLYVHELIPSSTTPSYNFKVNGSSYLGGEVKISDTNADTASVSMVYDRDMGCLNFIFN